MDNNYPKVIDGLGKVAIDYVSGYELKRIIEEIDDLGYSNYYYEQIIRDWKIKNNIV